MTKMGYAAEGSSARDWTYGSLAEDPAELPLTISIYADRARIRTALSEDASSAGLRVRTVGDLAALAQEEARPLGDVMVVDCPVADGATLAALMRLDERAARTGTRMIVSTMVDALEDVFGCLDQSGAQILVNPDRAERVIALGHVLAQFPSARLRELSDDERHLLMRLTEQVGQIAGRMERFAPAEPERGGISAPHPLAQASEARATRDAVKPASATPAPTPDPRMVRRIIRQRQMRTRHFEAQLFADPAWDMLLDLTAARAEHRRVSVTSLCIASGVPPTTALRWIGQMVEQGLFLRVGDQMDRRRAFIELSDSCAEAMARYFAEIGASAGPI